MSTHCQITTCTLKTRMSVFWMTSTEFTAFLACITDLFYSLQRLMLKWLPYFCHCHENGALGISRVCCLCAQSSSIYLMGFEFANAVFSFLSFLDEIHFIWQFKTHNSGLYACLNLMYMFKLEQGLRPGFLNGKLDF